jgi:membrane fusion protein (multidrug efflux system)
MANGEEFDQQGEITTIEADFNNTTGNIAFRATFSNPDRLLRHGETGSILMESKLENALLIPQKTTFEVLDQRFVYVIDKDNVVRTTKIKVAGELEHLFIIEEGLEETDRILLEGLRKVKNEDKLACEFIEPQSVLQNLEMYAE